MLRRLGFSALLVIGFVGQANASLIGDSVECEMTGGLGGSPLLRLYCSPEQSVVTPNPEFNILWFGSPFWDVDVESESFSIEHTGMGFTLGPDAVLELTGLSWGVPGVITDVDVSFSGIGNFDPADVTFDASSVFVDLGASIDPTDSVQWGRGSRVDIDLTVRHDVPEPSSLFVLVSGLVGLVGCARRKD